jgi:hypothetical protein
VIYHVFILNTTNNDIEDENDKWAKWCTTPECYCTHVFLSLNLGVHLS